LAALDKKLRESTQAELLALQRRLGMTFIIVTHDQEEAMTVADRIGVMDQGRLEQVARPRELYEAPNSRWIAEFVGDVNMFEDNSSRARPAASRLRRATPAPSWSPSRASRSPRRSSASRSAREDKTVAARPGLRCDQRPCHQPARRVVTDVSYLGGLTTYKVKLDTGAVLRSSMANTARLDLDAYTMSQRVIAWFTPDDCVVLEQ